MSIDYKNLPKNLKGIKFDDVLSTIKTGLIDFLEKQALKVSPRLKKHILTLKNDIDMIDNNPFEGHKNPFKIYLNNVFMDNKKTTELWGSGISRELGPRIPLELLDKFYKTIIPFEKSDGTEFSVDYQNLLFLGGITFKAIYDVNIASLLEAQEGGKKSAKKKYTKKSKKKSKKKKSVKKSKNKKSVKKSKKKKTVKKSKKKKSVKKSKTKTSKYTKKKCQSLLSKKIKLNSRKFSNHKQAIAVSYSQIKKKYPRCKKHFKY